MKIWLFLFCLFCSSFTLQGDVPDTLITNSLEGGRLGVQVNRFVRAFLISKLHKIPFRYTDKRNYFSQLSADQYLQKFSKSDFDYFDTIIHIKSVNDLTTSSETDGSTLFVCDRYTEFDYFECLENHPEYKKELQQILYPKLATPPDIPSDYISVAIHYRTGRGYDGPFLQDQTERDPAVEYVDVRFPLRFIPLEFYLDQLEWLFQRLDKTPLFVRIFTDTPEFLEVLDAFQQRFSEQPIIFSHELEIDYKKSAIFEWWYMSFFDCLIRPSSNYSEMAQLIGDHKIIIYPIESHFEGTRLIIDKVQRDERRE